mgnify:CR=1 FL=1
MKTADETEKVINTYKSINYTREWYASGNAGLRVRSRLNNYLYLSMYFIHINVHINIHINIDINLDKTLIHI